MLKSREIGSLGSLVKTYKSDEAFRREWKSLWTDIARKDGGKLSLTTMGVILGSALGGVGIAAMGGAIGMPLALVLGLSGFLAGSKIDDTGILSEKEKLSISLPHGIYGKLVEDAEKVGCSIEELVETLVERTYAVG